MSEQSPLLVVFFESGPLGLWLVTVDRHYAVADEDPPVWVIGDPDVTTQAQTWEKISTVSEFALGHLFWYNDYAVNCVKRFPANLSKRETRQLDQWLNRTMAVHDGFQTLFFYENADAAGIMREKRIDISLFQQPNELDMPEYLWREMEAHQKLCEEMKHRWATDAWRAPYDGP